MLKKLVICVLKKKNLSSEVRGVVGKTSYDWLVFPPRIINLPMQAVKGRGLGLKDL